MLGNVWDLILNYRTILFYFVIEYNIFIDLSLPPPPQQIYFGMVLIFFFYFEKALIGQLPFSEYFSYSNSKI